MKRIKYIATIAATYGLLFAIVFPSVLHVTHLFEDHEHTFCGNVETHLHEQELDCDFTKFLSPVASNVFFSHESDTHLPKEAKLNFYYSAPQELGISQAIQVRGPPHFQQS